MSDIWTAPETSIVGLLVLYLLFILLGLRDEYVYETIISYFKLYNIN